MASVSTPPDLANDAVISPEKKNNLRLVIIASSVGTLIEWYDLLLAVIMANILSMQLFPAGGNNFIETLGIVATTYLIRPFGSLLFGNFGDKIGRKYTFLVSLLLMGGATFLIGCIPTYEQAGWISPILFLILRLMQGLAISGEYSGAVIYVAEHAPQNKRGFYTGFIQTTSSIAMILGLVVVFSTKSIMSAESFNSFGWRIPFLFSAILVIASYFIRRRLHESPVFAQLKSEGKTSKSPVKETFKTKKNIGLILGAIFGGNAAQSAIMQTNQFITLFFLQRTVKLPDTTALLIMASGILLAGPFFQIFGALSDKIGRMLTLSGTMVYGPMGAFLMEMFPTRIRYTSMGFVYNVGNGAIGGSTPVITELIKSSVVIGFALSPFIGLVYPLALIVIGIIVNIFFVPETYKNDLSD